MSDKITKREEVKRCIEAGEMTKADIAAELNMSPGSVSTQKTYLTWMGYFVAVDPETKIWRFVEEEEYNKLEAEKKANRKTKSTSTRSPAERVEAGEKTIERQEKQLASWETKLETAQKLSEEFPDDEDTSDLVDEAEANVTLLTIKLKRNKAKLTDDKAEALAVADAEDVEEDAVDEAAEELL